MVLYIGLDIAKVGFPEMVGVPDFGPELGNQLQLLILFVYQQLVETKIEIVEILYK